MSIGVIVVGAIVGATVADQISRHTKKKGIKEDVLNADVKTKVSKLDLLGIERNNPKDRM